MADKLACIIDLTNDDLPFIIPPKRNPKRTVFRQITSCREVTCIDLTCAVELCALCPNELGTGEKETSLVYVLRICGCVFGGECSKSTQGSGLYCPQKDHSKHGNQFPERIFNLDCGICLETGRPNRMRLDCGHVYCRKCLHEARKMNFSTCPLCKSPTVDSTAIVPCQRGREFAMLIDE